jgi:hypothetical protein
MQLTENNTKRVATCFADGWDAYLEVVRRDVLFHAEMFETLDVILSKRFEDMPFSLADFGCGDSSAVAPLLQKHQVTRYIGVDAALELIERATIVLAETPCMKELIAADMRLAIKELALPVDVIISSYALHHLSTADKAAFIGDAQSKLVEDGLFVMIDGILPEGKTREDYLARLEANLRRIAPEASEQDIAEHMDHPRLDDFPDGVATFKQIAKNQGWQDCEVIVDKGIFALLVFTR